MNISTKNIVLQIICTLATAAVLPLATAGTVESSQKLSDAGQYQEAAVVLRADPQPSGRVSGLLCGLHVSGLITDEHEEAKQACSAAATAHDPYGLAMYADAYKLDKPLSGIPHDEQGFNRYMAESAELGFPWAFDEFCADFYSKKMYVQATPFCKFAAANNLPRSMYVMSLMLLDGTGVIQDFSKARQFALASARMNYPFAYRLLGDLYKDGKQGVKMDSIQAYAWYALASSAAPDWTEVSQLRDSLQLSGDQIAEAQKMAGKWTTQAAPTVRDFYIAK